MKYTISIPSDGNAPIELIKPEITSVSEDLLAIGLFMKCNYDNLDTDEEKKEYLHGIQKLANSNYFENSSTKKFN